jgi:tetraacyldisaccharide 4'-kinase
LALQIKVLKGILFFFLLPLAVVWDVITRLRNRLYDLELKPSVAFNVPVISVGNLTVGGTGKTPMTEYLVHLLHQRSKVAVLSRGYGRDTKGLYFVRPDEDALAVGDEALQVVQKFPDICVAVCEDRVYAVPHIIDRCGEDVVLILDDAFQHRRIKPGFSVLLTDYARPFYCDYLLPAGRLRESRRGAERADVVVVTKCPPDLGAAERVKIQQAIQRYAPVPVFFSTIRYGQLQPLTSHNRPSSKVVLVSGIARPAMLEEYVMKQFTLLKHFRYRDHHRYTMKDVMEVNRFIASQKDAVSLITTEKDAVKLTAPPFREVTEQWALFVLPVTIGWLENGNEFDKLVLNYVQEPRG